MKFLLFVLLFLLPLCGNAQDISGSWFWKSDNDKAQMEFTLTAEGSGYTGNHCSVFQNGDRIDCVGEDEPASIRIQRTAENEFEGVIRSGYSASEGKIKLHFNPETKTLFLVIFEAPGSIFYLPKKAFFKKI